MIFFFINFLSFFFLINILIINSFIKFYIKNINKDLLLYSEEWSYLWFLNTIRLFIEKMCVNIYNKFNKYIVNSFKHRKRVYFFEKKKHFKKIFFLVNIFFFIISIYNLTNSTFLNNILFYSKKILNFIFFFIFLNYSYLLIQKIFFFYYDGLNNLLISNIWLYVKEKILTF